MMKLNELLDMYTNDPEYLSDPQVATALLNAVCAVEAMCSLNPVPKWIAPNHLLEVIANELNVEVE